MSYSSSYSNINGVEDRKEKKMYDDGSRLKVYKRHNDRSEEKEFLEQDRKEYYNKKYSLQRPKFIEEPQSEDISEEQEEEKLTYIIPRRIFDRGFFNPENIIKKNLIIMNQRMFGGFNSDPFF